MRALLPLIALSGLCAAHQAVAKPPQYPKLGAYRVASGAGAPYINVDDRTLNMTAIKSDARFDVVVVHSTPFTLHRPDVLEALRKLNPRIKLYAYIQGGFYWCNPNPAYGDTTNDFPWLICQLVQSSDSIVWARDGSSLAISYHDPQFVLDFANLIADKVGDTQLWDALFIDSTCVMCQYGPVIVDHQRMGFATWNDYCTAYRTGHHAFTTQLRARIGEKGIMVGNCGASADGTYPPPPGLAERHLWNGWMRENFPWQNGGTWEANMLQAPWGDPGYLEDDLYRAPAESWLCSWPIPMDGSDPYSADCLRIQRFGLASASLGSGYHSFTVSSQGYSDWTFPEWFVDSKGVAQSDPVYKGWLGRALREPQLNNNVWVRMFEHGAVLVNPGNTTKKVTMPRRFRRILSNMHPIYDGKAGSTFTVPPMDGLFLQVIEPYQRPGRPRPRR